MCDAAPSHQGFIDDATFYDYAQLQVGCRVQDKTDGKLQPGESWIQASVIGSRFDASYMIASAGQIIPTITGTAHLCSEGTLIQQPDDPFKNGIVGRST